MKILDMLYDGKIYPAESIKPESERYKKLDAERSKVLDELHDALSDVQVLQLEQVVTLSYSLSDEECRYMFIEGLRFGIGLMTELDEMNRQS